MFSIDYCPTENMAVDTTDKATPARIAGKVQSKDLDSSTPKSTEHVTEGEC